MSVAEDSAPSGSTEPTPEQRAAAVREFLNGNWGAQPLRTVAHPAADNFASRRDAVSMAFPGRTLVVPSGRPKVRANDDDYRFRPGSDFYYLTGAKEPEDVLIMTPTESGHTATLYMNPRSDAGSETFFNYGTGEMWVPPRPGLPETTEHLKIATAPLSELPGVLSRLDPDTTLTIRGIDPRLDGRLRRNPGDNQLASTVAELRLIKDAYEVRQLEKAVTATTRGFKDVVRSLGQAIATSERWVEGVFNRRARVEGNDVGYGSIAAAGEHATTLHWTQNDGPVRSGDLLLLDAGVEGNELYTADVTRTIPVSGQFTPAQRRVYNVVLEAQRAGIRACKPGADFLAPSRAATEVLASGLRRLGIPSVALPQYVTARATVSRYMPHGVSHSLGIDVHDCARARNEYYVGKLQPGNVLTVEPGLYFKPNDLTVPAEYRGIGVRIEDDILITKTGHRNLSIALPKDPDAIERWVARAAAKSPVRDIGLSA